MHPNQYPEACRTYARLSPDIHCGNHLDYHLAENGHSLESYFNWLTFRLNTDPLLLTNIDYSYDASLFDNLNAIG